MGKKTGSQTASPKSFGWTAVLGRVLWQQFGRPIRIGLGQPRRFGKQPCQVAVRIEPVLLRRLNQAENHGAALRAPCRVRKKEVLPGDHKGLDTANYNVKTGTLIPWAKPASGGGSSGGGSNGGSSSSGGSSSGGSSGGGSSSGSSGASSGASSGTSTTTNPDGSKTTTTTNADGSKTAVTTAQDGSTTTTTTAKDGSATTTEKAADGSTGTVKTDAQGNTVSAEVVPSSKAIEDAAKSGEAVTLPVEIKAATNAESAAEVRVTLPASVSAETPAKVEIPVENLAPGTVAVIVHADGTEEIVKTSTTSEDGVVLTLEESATVKIVDNTKYFSDVHTGDWFAPYIAWAASRGIMNGMGDGTFAPDATASRAQIAQMLFNLDGAKANGGLAAFADVHAGDWFADAVTWLVENGIAQGTGESFGADSPISREQLAVMLYNYAQFKGYDVSAHGDVSGFPDADKVDGYAQAALAWAVGAGLISGTTDENGNIVLDPQGSATRGQIAAIIERFCEKVAR